MIVARQNALWPENEGSFLYFPSILFSFFFTLCTLCTHFCDRPFDSPPSHFCSILTLLFPPLQSWTPLALRMLHFSIAIMRRIFRVVIPYVRVENLTKGDCRYETFTSIVEESVHHTRKSQLLLLFFLFSLGLDVLGDLGLPSASFSLFAERKEKKKRERDSVI